MSTHEPFTADEATNTEAGRIRGVILDTIALRVGQVPDVHPRLLEGIEVAARLLADQRPEPNEERLWWLYLSGAATGIATYLVNRGTAPDVAGATARAVAMILDADPALRLDLLEGIVRVYQTGEASGEEWQKRTAYVMGHRPPNV